ncbi:MAG: MFS transporter [Parvibaculaceae bacterium]|nr:MFS transporter [Parvibaculaceae bacterium]
MHRTFASFVSLYLSTAILLIGNGLLGSLVPLRADADHLSATTLGWIGGAYFAGFLAGCVFCPRVVRRAGHIRSFGAFAAAASSAPLVLALIVEPLTWCFFRALTGFCFAGLYMVIESWINEKATNETRGSLFSIYLIVNFIGIVLGQLLLNAASPAGFVLFAIVSILTSAALIPVSLTRSVQPAPIQTVNIDVRAIYRLSPVGFVGCFVVGLTNSPFWTMGPVFATRAGLDIAGASYFMTSAILGGALAQWPVGRISDRVDRRKVIIGVCLVAAVGETLLMLAGSSGHPWLLLPAGFLFGCSALTLYSLCVAHANDNAGSREFVSVSSGLLVAYAGGAIIGPVAASWVTPLLGFPAIFLFMASIHGLFVLFVLYRITRKESVPAESRADFVSIAISRTGPDPVELDPRNSPPGAAAAE